MTWRQWIYTKFPFLVGMFGLDKTPSLRKLSCTGFEQYTRKLINPKYFD